MALLVYRSALFTPFIYDDHSAIVENPNLRSLRPLRDSLAAPRDTPAAGRPLVSFSLAVDHALFGLDPRGYHATNLAIHGLGALALLGLVTRTLRLPVFAGRFAASAGGLGLAVALVWLVHPLQTEVVNYAIQRSESLMSLCYLLTLLASLRAGRTPGFAIVAVAACALGMAAKESMVTAPLAVVLYDLAYREGTRAEVARARAPLWAGLAAGWVVLALLWAGAPRGNSVGTGLGVTPLQWALNQAEVVVHYLRLVIWPVGLVLDYGLPRPLGPADVRAELVGLAALLAGVLWLFVTRPRVGYPALFFFLVLAPTSSVVPIATEVAAERRLHLALAGPISLAVVGGLVLLTRAFGGRSPRLGLALLALLVGGLGLLSHRRTLEYRSEASIWATVTERAPDNYRAHYNLGTSLGAEGRLAEAESALRHALAIEPGHLRSRYNLGVVLAMQGLSEPAIRELEAALVLDPGDPAAHQSLAILLQARGERSRAAEHYRRALERDPGRTVAQVRLAWILATAPEPELRDAAEASRLAELANQALRGADPGALEVLAAAYAAAGRPRDAAAAAARAAELAELAGDRELAERLRSVRERHAQGLGVELR